MNGGAVDNGLRARLHRSLASAVPDGGAERRVLGALRSEAGAVPMVFWRRWFSGGLGGALVAATVILLLGGALAAGLTLRNRDAASTGTRPEPTLPAATQPAASTLPPTGTSTPAASVAPAPPCDGTMLRASIADTTGAAGSQGADIALRNVTATACVMKGYATLAGVSGGHPIALRTVHSSHETLLNDNNGRFPPLRLITLRPGQVAYVAVQWSDVPGADGCRSYTGLLVTPPGGSHAASAAGAFTICSQAGVAMDVAPVSSYRYF